jgi:hypothetical protein
MERDLLNYLERVVVDLENSRFISDGFTRDQLMDIARVALDCIRRNFEHVQDTQRLRWISARFETLFDPEHHLTPLVRFVIDDAVEGV